MKIPTRREVIVGSLAMLLSAILPQSWRVQLHRRLHDSMRRAVEEEQR